MECRKKSWERYSNVKVAIKKIVESNMEDFTDLFKELKAHLMSNDQIIGRFNVLRVYGITYNPESKMYMMVMELAAGGDLSIYLQTHFSILTYIKQIEILYDIATGLTQIHRSGLIHRDLNCRNVMCQVIMYRSQGRGEECRFVIDIKERLSAHELYMAIGTWLNQCLYVPRSEIAKELKKCDELRSKLQQQELCPDNFPYSTAHDVS
ncbi:16993_t:CDS:2, partial [Gigaspora margarita]